MGENLEKTNKHTELTVWIFFISGKKYLYICFGSKISVLSKNGVKISGKEKKTVFWGKKYLFLAKISGTEKNSVNPVLIIFEVPMRFNLHFLSHLSTNEV